MTTPTILTTRISTPVSITADLLVVTGSPSAAASASSRAAASTASPSSPAAPAAVHTPGTFEREIRSRLIGGRIDAPVTRPRGGARDADVEPSEPLFTGDEGDDPLRNPDSMTTSWPEPSDARRAGRRLVRRVRGARSRTADAWRVPMQVIIALCFGRMIDGAPGLLRALRSGTPRVIVEVPDPLTFQILCGIWQTLVFGRDAGTVPVSPSSTFTVRDDLAALTLTAADPIKPKERLAREETFLRALAMPLPIVCLVTDATALPEAALRAAEHRLTLPPFDSGLVAATVRIVTGRRRPTAALIDAIAGIDCARLPLSDLAIAVRADRTPEACIARLHRLVAARPSAGGTGGGSGVGRDLRLDQLHGLREAVDWARGALSDLEAWRAGAPWSSVASGAVIAGPPGTGKTLLAQAMAASGAIPLIAASLAQWQAADAAHLGTTLRAMRASFDEARAEARANGGAIILIDEIDSFPDRNTVVHDHRDYVIEVQNALLELIDGATPREGVIVVGTTNAAARLDPALTRPGRLSRVIEVGYPDLDERKAMLRVRLGGDLPEVDLGPVARLTERATGAAIEELVAEARRRARREGRALHSDDLIAAAGGEASACPPGVLQRMAIHEAGHALVAALELGTAGLVVALQERDGAGGWVETGRRPDTAGTRAEVEALIRVMLAGHAAETVLLGEPSAGAGGDLAQATKLAADLLGSWGLAGRGRLLSLGRSSAILADPALRAEAGALLALQHRRASALIDRRRAAVLAIAERLIVERRLDGAAVATLVGADPSHRAAREAVEDAPSRPGFESDAGELADGAGSPDAVDPTRAGGRP